MVGTCFKDTCNCFAIGFECWDSETGKKINGVTQLVNAILLGCVYVLNLNLEMREGEDFGVMKREENIDNFYLIWENNFLKNDKRMFIVNIIFILEYYNLKNLSNPPKSSSTAFFSFLKLGEFCILKHWPSNLPFKVLFSFNFFPPFFKVLPFLTFKV